MALSNAADGSQWTRGLEVFPVSASMEVAERFLKSARGICTGSACVLFVRTANVHKRVSMHAAHEGVLKALPAKSSIKASVNWSR